MVHIGKLLKKAIEVGGVSQAYVAEKVGKGKNTVHRWVSTPNLGLKEVREIQKAVPELYLKPVYDALEEELGHHIPDNPYRFKKETERESQPHGIRVMIDVGEFAGYRIPEDIIERFRNVLEEAQRDDCNVPRN